MKLWSNSLLDLGSKNRVLNGLCVSCRSCRRRGFTRCNRCLTSVSCKVQPGRSPICNNGLNKKVSSCSCAENFNRKVTTVNIRRAALYHMLVWYPAHMASLTEAIKLTARRSHDPSEESLVYHQHRFALDKALSPECRIIRSHHPPSRRQSGPRQV